MIEFWMLVIVFGDSGGEDEQFVLDTCCNYISVGNWCCTLHCRRGCGKERKVGRSLNEESARLPPEC